MEVPGHETVNGMFYAGSIVAGYPAFTQSWKHMIQYKMRTERVYRLNFDVLMQLRRNKADCDPTVHVILSSRARSRNAVLCPQTKASHHKVL